ncbi:MAG: helix-turn-helix domain-containing protein [bacterium]
MFEAIKENLYLDEKEAKVYLAGLELGRSRVSVIAKKAGLNRITTYEILKRLHARGFAASALYGKIIVFKVVEPEILIKKMQRKLDLAKQALPQLLMVSGLNKNKPKMEFYEGNEGIRTIYENTLDCRNKEILNIANPNNVLKIIGEDFFTHYVAKRVKRKIIVKVLLPDMKENKKYIKETKEALREVKYFNESRYILPNEILIWDTKVALLSFTAKIGVVIQDNDISQSMKSLWQMVWNNLKSYD